jgi:hypothetical protein
LLEEGREAVALCHSDGEGNAPKELVRVWHTQAVVLADHHYWSEAARLLAACLRVDPNNATYEDDHAVVAAELKRAQSGRAGARTKSARPRVRKK